MAFMVPVMRKDWDVYGAGPQSRRGSQCPSAPQSRRQSQASGGSHRRTSEASSGFSRRPSESSGGFSRQSSLASDCSAASGGRKHSRSGSGDAPRCVTFGPPSPPSSARHPRQAPEKNGFHTKVVDKLMKVLHKDKEASRRS